jgi:hypothetical protein
LQKSQKFVMITSKPLVVKQKEMDLFK